MAYLAADGWTPAFPAPSATRIDPKPDPRAPFGDRARRPRSSLSHRLREKPEATFSRDALGRFAQIERNVIALAAHDPVASIEPPGRLAGLLRHWLGLEPPNQLADPRLETLRRFTILLRAAPDRIRMPEVRRFLAAGFTTSQARALIGLAPKLA